MIYFKNDIEELKARGLIEGKMSRVDKFFRLSLPEKRLLIRALLLLWVIRLGQWLLPFQTLRNLLGYLIHTFKGRQNINSLPQDLIVWTVTAASRYVVKTTCLTRALTLQVLLKKEGYEVALRFGVARNNEGQLHAHAWVESEGKVLIVGSELDHYTTLLSLKEESR